MLTGALRQVFALSEAYPDLKANQNFLALQEELTAHRGSRGLRPPVLQRQRARLQQQDPAVPTVFIAKMLNFDEREYFEADEGARVAPTVEF